MSIVETVDVLAAGGVVVFGVLAFAARPKIPPAEFTLSPSPIYFAAQLSMAVMLLCAAIEVGVREAGSIRAVVYLVASLGGFVSVVLAYRRLHQRLKGKQQDSMTGL